MGTNNTGLQFDNKTSMEIVSGTIRYNDQNFEAKTTHLENFFVSSTATPPQNNWVQLSGPMNVRPDHWIDNRVEIYDQWGYDPITISLTFSDGHVITFEDIQRDAYATIAGQGVTITQTQGTNNIDNMSVIKWTRHDLPDNKYNEGLLTFTLHQDNVPLSNERWMARLSGTLPICDINLPGSHDSAAIFGVTTPWRAQDSDIPAQLMAGVRALDVRLKVVKDPFNGTYYFYTCHGSANFGPIGVYQPLNTLLAECTEFLRVHSTEAIVMSIKMDDWNGYNSDSVNVLNALRTLLANYPILTGRNDMPKLSEVRSRIYLFNRIDDDPTLGVPLHITDNQDGLSPSGSATFPIYVQDNYKYTYPQYTLSAAEADKMSRVENTFSLATTGIKWNFVSAVWGADVWQPLGVDINAQLMTWLGSKASVDRPAKLGWCFFDMVTTPMHVKVPAAGLPKTVTWPEMIISSNFSYENQGGASFSVR